MREKYPKFYAPINQYKQSWTITKFLELKKNNKIIAHCYDGTTSDITKIFLRKLPDCVEEKIIEEISLAEAVLISFVIMI